MKKGMHTPDNIYFCDYILLIKKILFYEWWFLSDVRIDNAIWNDDIIGLPLTYTVLSQHMYIKTCPDFFFHSKKRKITFFRQTTVQKSLIFSLWRNVYIFIKMHPHQTSWVICVYNPICAQISKDTIVEIYKNEAYMYHVFLSTLKGYRTVLQACWYLDLIKYGVQWPAFYSCDPHDFFGKVQHVSFWYFSLFGLFGVWVIHQC